MTTALVDLFLDAIRIDALSLKERPMAEFIRNRLEDASVRVVEDTTSQSFGGECGNLVCIPEGFDPGKPAIALFAHMDTPRSTVGIQPRLDGDRITSDGTTILGVDNRAGTSILLHVLREYHRSGQRGNFLVVFTVAEEIGMYGAKHVDLSAYNIKMGFVFDCSKRPGTFIQSAVGSSLYDATFVGRTSHAGVAPEKGINAIHLAAHAMSNIPVGRLNPKMTSNIGMISGGTATNVVPDRCTIHGEVRAFHPDEIDKHLAGLEQAFRKAASEFRGGVEFTTAVDFPPFVVSEESDVFMMTEDVLNSVGLQPNPIEYLGGSDANMLNNRGIPAINLGIGAQNPHGNDEFILLEDLETSMQIALEIITRSRSLP